MKLCSAAAHKDFKCERNELDKTSCTFSEIKNSFEFFNSLDKYKDNEANKISTINLQNASIDNIPAELFRMYTKLKTLNASNVELERIEKFDIIDAKILVSLNVSYNRVSKLPSGIIQDLPRLEILDLSYNLLSNIHRHAFEDHDIQLKFLNLSHNKLSELNFHDFANLDHLEELNLNHNYIEYVKNDNHISILYKLKKLYLQENKLTKFYPSLVQHTEVLDLSWNKLYDEKLYSGNLKEMFVVGCNMAELSVNSSLETLVFKDNNESILKLNGNTKMKHLEIEFKHHNPNKTLLDDINQMENLTFLLISGLEHNFTANSFANLRKLEHLHLILCKLKRIPLNFFQNLQQLQTLNLSENPLNVLDLHELNPLKKLEVLCFVNTRSKVLLYDEDVKTILPNLKEVSFPVLSFDCNYYAQIIEKFSFARINWGNHRFIAKTESKENRTECLEPWMNSKSHPNGTKDESLDITTIKHANLSEDPIVDETDFSINMLIYVIVSLLLMSFCIFFIHSKLKRNNRFLGRFSFTKGSEILKNDDSDEIIDTY